MSEIECSICHAKGTRADISRDGWRHAANWAFAYTCSPECDDKAIAIEDAKSAERKAARKGRKQ